MATRGTVFAKVLLLPANTSSASLKVIRPAIGPGAQALTRMPRAPWLGTEESDVRKLGHGFRPSEEVRSAAAATTLRAVLKP
jgi:hypothetical protein